MTEFEQLAGQLVDAGKQLYGAGMVPATSGNISARLSDDTVAITVSGAHKGFLTKEDVMPIDARGVSLDGRRSSAETLLHTYLYQRFPATRVVLHPHSISATVISRLCGDSLVLEGYELLKAFKGINTHDCALQVPVFDNDQDISRLAKKVDERLENLSMVYGYLIRGHGFYTWGDNMADALRHVEAFEFLFNCELQLRGKE